MNIYAVPLSYLRSTTSKVKSNVPVTTSQIVIDKDPIESVIDELVISAHFINTTTAESEDLIKNPNKYVDLSEKYKDFLK